MNRWVQGTSHREALLSGQGPKMIFTIGVVVSAFVLCSPLWASPPLWAQKPDRSRPPELEPPPTLTLPPIQRIELSNGLPVFLLEKHDVPLVQINVLIKAGSAMDPAGKGGLASVTADMLDEGAGSRDALELADAIDFLGARLSASAGFHTSTVALHAPLSNAEAGLALLADLVLRPRFPPKELERLRKERLTALIQWHDEPRIVASVLFNRALFGPMHPYGRPAIGREETVRALSVADLKQFHSTYFRPNNAAVIVVGDVSADWLRPRLEKAFGQWEAGKVPAWVAPKMTPGKSRRVLMVDKPGAAQSEVRIGHVGVRRLTRDYYSLVVMNTILGGSFTSRLNQNLREEHGYSYGAFSFFSFRPLPGPFQALAAVQTAVTDKALTEFMKELNGILDPVSDEDLRRAKNYVALRFPENFRTVARTANQLEDLVIYGLPLDYYNQYTQRILAVTKEDVHRVAKKYIHPEKLTVVVVGDGKRIEGGVRALKLGPVEMMTIDDVLGKAPVISDAN